MKTMKQLCWAICIAFICGVGFLVALVESAWNWCFEALEMAVIVWDEAARQMKDQPDKPKVNAIDHDRLNYPWTS